MTSGGPIAALTADAEELTVLVFFKDLFLTKAYLHRRGSLHIAREGLMMMFATDVLTLIYPTHATMFPNSHPPFV